MNLLKFLLKLLLERAKARVKYEFYKIRSIKNPLVEKGVRKSLHARVIMDIHDALRKDDWEERWEKVISDRSLSFEEVDREFNRLVEMEGGLREANYSDFIECFKNTMAKYPRDIYSDELSDSMRILIITLLNTVPEGMLQLLEEEVLGDSFESVDIRKNISKCKYTSAVQHLTVLINCMDIKYDARIEERVANG